MAQAPPIQFDRTTGVLSGANAWERGASLALLAGSKISSLYYHRGYNMAANLLKRLLPERDTIRTIRSRATSSNRRR